MDDSRLPWWLVILLAIGVVGIAVWQSSRAKPHIRWGALSLGLIYLALLGFTIGGDPRGVISLRAWGTSQYLLAGLSGLSIVAAALLIGGSDSRGQAFWFGLLSLINAGICVAQRANVVALVLALTGVAGFAYLVAEFRRGRPLRGVDLFPQHPVASEDHSSSAIWLSVSTGLVLSIVLIGTIHQALHAESSRATATRRFSAMPAQSRIRSLLYLPEKTSQRAELLDIVVEQRTDLVVLVSVLAFVAMAAVFASGPSTKVIDESPSQPT